jgi:cardiolipin synthase
MNIPNTITMMRIMLVPFLAYLLLHGAYGAAIWVFLMAGISDVLDGFIARRFNLRTRLGAVLDPLADKMLVIVSVLTLAWLGLLPWWLALVIAGRDLLIVGGAVAYYLSAGSVEMEPTIPSKLNTGVQILLILVILGQAAGGVRSSGWLPVLYGVVLFTTVISGGHYVVVWGRRAAALRKSGQGKKTFSRDPQDGQDESP